MVRPVAVRAGGMFYGFRLLLLVRPNPGSTGGHSGRVHRAVLGNVVRARAQCRDRYGPTRVDCRFALLFLARDGGGWTNWTYTSLVGASFDMRGRGSADEMDGASLFLRDGDPLSLAAWPAPRVVRVRSYDRCRHFGTTCCVMGRSRCVAGGMGTPLRYGLPGGFAQIHAGPTRPRISVGRDRAAADARVWRNFAVVRRCAGVIVAWIYHETRARSASKCCSRALACAACSSFSRSPPTPPPPRSGGEGRSSTPQPILPLLALAKPDLLVASSQSCAPAQFSVGARDYGIGRPGAHTTSAAARGFVQVSDRNLNRICRCWHPRCENRVRGGDCSRPNADAKAQRNRPNARSVGPSRRDAVPVWRQR